MQRHPSIVLIILLLVSAGFGETAKPKGPRLGDLEPKGELPKGFGWVFGDGADFYVWRAARGKDASAGIGLYFGTAPDFQPPKDAKEEDGTVASLPVEWSIWTKGGKYYRAALLPYGKILTVHVWVYAVDPHEMDALVGCLKTVRFVKHDQPTGE